MTLHKINDGFVKLEQLSKIIMEAEAKGEDVTDFKLQLKEEFSNAEIALSEKLDGVIFMIINQESDIKELKEESERLAKKAKSKQNQIDFYKKNLILPALQNLKDCKYKNIYGSLYINHSKSVEVVDASQVPAEYKKIETIEKIDKKVIKDKLKAGEKIAGVNLKESQSAVLRK